MMNLLFLGMAGVLLLASLYWYRVRGNPRPAGAGAMSALLASFALAFASYAPLLTDAAESAVPHVARLLSNSFSLAAATSVLAFLFQLNLHPEEARQRVRRRAVLLAAAVAGMTAMFGAEQLTHHAPPFYTLYMLIYIAFLGFTVKDFLQQTWRQSLSARRQAQRVGLRITVAGCLFALLYLGYKVTKLVAHGLGWASFASHAPCSSLVTPAPCAFSVTAPALAVLLITVGLTLPAVAWPVSQFVRRRWESRSYETLGSLWQELSSVTPEVVLAAGSGGEEPDFLLHRRIIEINDSILALRPYRSIAVQSAAHRAVAPHRRNTLSGAARVEAAILAAAVHAKRSGDDPCLEQAPPAAGTRTRADSLRAETEWLLLVAREYARTDSLRAVTNARAATEAV